MDKSKKSRKGKGKAKKEEELAHNAVANIAVGEDKKAMEVEMKEKREVVKGEETTAPIVKTESELETKVELQGKQIDTKSKEYQTSDGHRTMGKEQDIVKHATEQPKNDLNVIKIGDSVVNDAGMLSDKYVAEMGTVINQANKAQLPTDSQMKEVEEAVKSLYVNPYVGNPIQINYKTFIRDLRIVNKFPCLWSWKTINILNNRRQKFTYNLKIKPFTDQIEFYKNRMALAQDVLSNYEVIFRDVPQVENVFQGLSRVTDPSYAGLNVTPESLKDLYNDDVEKVRRYFKYDVRVNDVYNPDGSENELVKDYNAYVEYREFEVILNLQENMKSLILPNGIDRKYAFLKNLENKWRYLPPLDRNLQRQWWYVIHDQYKFESPFRALLDNDNNLMMREFIRRYGSNIINETISFTTIDATGTIDTLAKSVGLNNTQINQINQLPGNISTPHGTNFYMNLFNVFMNRKWSELYMEITFEGVPDLTLLLSCFQAKLFTPHFVWCEKTRIDIDNYIYLNFICRMPQLLQQNEFPEPTISVLKSSSRNFLVEAFTKGVHGNNHLPYNFIAILKSFLLTTKDGNGWANAGQNQCVELSTIPDYKIFLNNRDCLYQYYTGKEVKDEEENIQMSRFKKLIRCLTVMRDFFVLPGTARIATPFLAMFSFYAALSGRFSAMIYHFNERLHALSLLCTWDTLRSTRIENDELRQPIVVLPFSIISMISQIEHYNLAEPLIDPKHFEQSFRFIEFFDMLCAQFSHVNELKQFNVIPKTDRIKLAIEYCKSLDPGFIPFFNEKILGTSAWETMYIPPPSNPFWLNRIRIAYDFIDSMIGHMGYTNEFYFDARPNDGAENLDYIKYFPKLDGRIIKTINYSELFELVHNDLTLIFRNAKLNGYILKFEMPIMFEEREMTNLDGKQDVPFTYDGGLTPLKLGSLHWLFQYKDDYINENHPFVAMNYEPRFYITDGKEPNVRGKLIDIIKDKFSCRFYAFKPEWKQFTTYVIARQNRVG